MLSVSRPTSPALKSLARITLATMLLLVLLAGAVPFSSLSSSHECGMACCAGKPSHMAGSCSTALIDEEHEAETPAEPNDDDDAHSAHGHNMRLSGATSQADTSNKLHQSTGRTSARYLKSGIKESPPTASVHSQAMTTPCSPECAAASVSTQVRRPRDPAAASINLRPRPPTSYLLAGCFTVPSPKSAEGRRLSHPRAPPVLPKNLPV